MSPFLKLSTIPVILIFNKSKPGTFNTWDLWDVQNVTKGII